MTLSAGSKLGPYEIVEPIGKGGMGEVYRARDPRMGRDVAIKVSAERFSERFDREVRAIAALNHSNICTLHDVGPNYLVMELVEGQTLADRIGQGPIPLEEALAIARQIAEALETAHSQGITHRDLKPGNTKLRPDGTVKVLDFGLAKVGPRPASSGEFSPDQSPTLSAAMTEAGVILGTAAYMAPEQARGKSVDKRADIWAFGVVLYEMVTGRRLFQGEDLTDTLATVVKVEPDLGAAPPELLPLLRKCLQKDPRKRLRDISGVELLLDYGRTEAARPAEVVPATAGSRPWLWPSVAALFALFTAVAWWAPWRAATVEQPLHLNVSLPPDTTPAFLQLSPDGTRLLASFGGALQIRRLDSPGWQELVRPGGRGPFWSPDSRFVAFFADGSLKKISAAGGPVQELCAETDAGSNGDWNSDDVILFTTFDDQLRRVDGAGGTCHPLWDDDPNVRLRYPKFLPDGEHFLFTRFSRNDPTSNGIYVGALGDTAQHRILVDQASAVYVPSIGGEAAQILFRRDGALMAQPFDAGRLEPVGDPFQVTSQVARTFNNEVAASFANRTLVYMTGGEGESRLTWFDRSGTALGTVGPLVEQGGLRLSPDGSLLVLARTDNDQQDLWIYDVDRDTGNRLLPVGSAASGALWLAEGRRLVFGLPTPTGIGVYLKDLDAGGGDEELIGTIDPNLQVGGSDVSRDGQYVLATVATADSGRDLVYFEIDASSLGVEAPVAFDSPVSFLATRADEREPRFSPDGRWVAYASSGTPGGVFIRSFPSGSAVLRVGPGRQPLWSDDGRSLYHIRPDQGEYTLFETDVTPGGSAGLQVGTPRELFRFRARAFIGDVPAYAAHPDGERFLVNVLPEPTPPEIHVLPDWRPEAPE